MKSHHLSTIAMALSVGTLTIATGCTSFRSTIVNRLSNDSLKPQCETRTSRGVPVKLQVPTHMDVRIVETYFLGPGPSVATRTPRQVKDQDVELDLDYKVAADRTVSITPQAKPGKHKFTIAAPTETKVSPPTMHRPGIEKGIRLLSVESEPIYTDKVFTVDFPRPLAGTLSLTTGDNKADGITFDANQYFASIRGSYKEETLSTVNAILGDSAKGDTKSSGNTIAMKSNAKYTQLKRVVAFERFDISECGWEQRMQDFVDQHIGACNPPCESGCSTATDYGVVEEPLPVDMPIYLETPVGTGL